VSGARIQGGEEHRFFIACSVEIPLMSAIHSSPTARAQAAHTLDKDSITSGAGRTSSHDAKIQALTIEYRSIALSMRQCIDVSIADRRRGHGHLVVLLPLRSRENFCLLFMSNSLYEAVEMYHVVPPASAPQ
jgi:hypothetical protein